MALLEVNPSEKIGAESSEDIVNATPLSLDTAMSIHDVAQTRAQRRNEWDCLIEITDWLAEQRGGHKYLLCEALEDASDKAYLAKGVRDVNITAIRENDAESVTEILTMIDETESDYVDEKGVTFIPKSQIESIIELE